MIVGAISTAATAQNQQGSGTGTYLADRYGMTCYGLIHAADATDVGRPRLYKDLLSHLIEQKWRSVSHEKLRRLVHERVIRCERHGPTDFETAA